MRDRLISPDSFPTSLPSRRCHLHLPFQDESHLTATYYYDAYRPLRTDFTTSLVAALENFQVNSRANLRKKNKSSGGISNLKVEVEVDAEIEVEVEGRGRGGDLGPVTGPEVTTQGKRELQRSRDAIRRAICRVRRR